MRPYFPQPRFAAGPFSDLPVCLSVEPERRPKFGSTQARARCAPSNDGNPNFSTGRRGFDDDVTATLLALLRHTSRRRRAPRPAAGSPTHAIAGTRARAVTMATVRPPSLLNHITPGGWQAAVRHDTVVSRRARRRHATAASSDFFCVPFGGRANGRVSTPPTPSEQRRRPGAAVRRGRRLHLRLRLRP